ncbi:MAG: hypothetical protein LUH08_07170 [Ruminococcus sp.]|nr:hypothetical protein [Ruminococcus sp.]
MAQNLAYKCPTCGGELSWNAQTGSFKCKYCEDEFTNEQLEQLGENEINEQKAEKHRELEGDKKLYTATDGTDNSDLVVYTCSHCGAEIITNRTTAATICVYCQSPIVMSEQVIGNFSPKYIIPFKIEKEKVMEAFKNFAKKPLTPKAFNPDAVVEKMQGVYVPFWFYSGVATGSVRGTGETAKKYNRGASQFRETCYYEFTRSGSIEIDKVPVDASKKIENDAMDSIEPYDIRDLKEFSPAYLAGFLAERYDQSSAECFERAELRIKNSLESNLKRTTSYDNVHIKSFDAKVEVKSCDYALLPTWLLYTKYKGESYLFAMNGQTGKFIGNLPIDNTKLALYSALGFVAGFIIVYLLMLFF